MEWERFFEDLEVQWASQQEAEHAVLDVEAERVRQAALTLRDRVRGLGEGAWVSCETRAGSVSGAVVGVGADWCCLEDRRAHLVPLRGVRTVSLDDSAARDSLAPSVASTTLADRMGFGFVLRALARRRAPVRVSLDSQRVLTGTIDRAGADHLDLAEHDADAPRRGAEVRAIHLISFAAVCFVRVEDARGIG